MKTIIEEKDLTVEALANLIEVASFGSTWLDYQYNKQDCENAEDGDFSCDIAAKLLVGGKQVEFIDYNAEDPSDVYAETAHFERNAAIYPVGLQDVKKGLEMALNGTFKDADDYKDYARECAQDLFDEDSGGFDQAEAETLMQIIMFGELVY